MSKRNKIIVSIVGITIILLALLGITYAYYLTRIEGNTNTNSISITTADLKLVYGDGNGLVTKENIMPGTTIEKTFTVTNDGNNKVDLYAVYLEELTNTLSRTEDLTYVLTCESTGEDCDGNDGEFPTLAGMIVTNSIDTNVTHTYTLTVTYKNEENIDQSIDMGSKISAFVQIYALKDIVDIEGSVNGTEDGDFAQINSVQKRSQIVDGKYKFVGVLPGTHTIKICSKSDANCTSPKLEKEIMVNLGNTSGVDGNKITITDNSQTVTIDIDLTQVNIENKVIIGTTIKEMESTIKNPFAKGTLAYNILNNAINSTGTESTKYSAVPLTIPGKESSGENERTLSIAEDDYGTSYYFRGNVVDNYVNFAEMCWRIVRIEGDGSVKLILEDRYEQCNDKEGQDLNNNGTYFTGNWRGRTEDYYVFGYDGDYRIDFFNYTETDGLQYSFESFQTNNLKQSDLDKLKVDEWCYDDKITKTYTYCEDWDDDGIEEACSIEEDYGAYTRIYTNKKPSLNCIGTRLTKFRDDVDMYVGTLTADEIVFAGGTTSPNFNYYLINNYVEDNNLTFWTLSPSAASEFYDDHVLLLSKNGRLGMEANDSTNRSRPSISFKPVTLFSGGDGTQFNPYVIE